MTTMGKGRGRPHGTGLNDEPVLAKMADLMVANPKLKPTTAFKRVEAEPDASTIRRIQTKWKASGKRFLERAQSKVATALANSKPLAQPVCDLSRLDKVALAASGLPTSFGASEVYKMTNSPALQTMRDTYNSPTMRTMREIYDGSAMKAACKLYHTPNMRMMRELQDGPIASALRELETFKRVLRGF